MSKDVDNTVTKQQLLRQLNDVVSKYKITKALGKENVCEQTIGNKQKTIKLVTDMQKRLEFLKSQI